MKVCIWPSANEIQSNHGIGRIVHAQHKYLPELGIKIVGPLEADVIACHTQQNDMPRVDVLHLHGMYWTAEPHTGRYVTAHHRANHLIAEAARRALAITVPSKWVAMPFKRDMRISPIVIGHGIDIDEWGPGDVGDYVLWNKNRDSDVCDPTPAWELAQRGIPVISTFGLSDRKRPDTLSVVGALPNEDMKVLVRQSNVYLATVKETFGIGTLEAMACGVPILGFDHGGTASLVTHKTDGYLAKPGDYDDLYQGYLYILEHRQSMSEAARSKAEKYTWPEVMQRYADLYHSLSYQTEMGVSIVITSYNYGQYLETSINSALSQSLRCEVIVVDDGSTDATPEIAARYDNRIRYIRQDNRGVASARNHGIAEAKGELIICLDADDALHPQYAEVLQKEMKADRGLGIAYTGLSLLKDTGLQYVPGWPPEFSWETQIAGGAPPSNCIPSASMFRKDMWMRAGGYRQQYKPAEDAEFWTRGLSLGFTAKKVASDGLFHYRPHAKSASRNNPWHPIDSYLPFIRDKQSPFAAPSEKYIPVRSYSEPVVSIIIPVTEKHADSLELAIESVAGQSFRDWELIVIDDSGGIVIEQYSNRYPFITWEVSDHKGPGHARNIGIDSAQAPLCLFLDADDYLHPDAVLKMVLAYIQQGGKYIYSDWYQNGEKHESSDFTVKGILTGPRHPVTALVPTIAARAVEFSTRMKALEDWDFFARLVISGYHGYRQPEALVYVNGSLSTRTPHALKDKARWDRVLKTKYANAEVEVCCGNDGGAVIRAKQAIGMIPQEEAIMSENVTRMEFTGGQKGSVTYGGPGITPTGTRYTAGNNALNKYINAEPTDVKWLLGTGLFRVVNLEKPSVTAAVINVQPPPLAEVIPPVELKPLADLVAEKLGPDNVEDTPDPLPVQVAMIPKAIKKAKK